MSSYKIIDTGINSPDISIAMLAYNHEKFIGEAIESVLMQKTNYTYKIIIAEDFSTDKTREIILDYKKKYPDKIKLILQDRNVGASQNNVDLLSNLEGKYIAALEGDDYWTDPLKLQKQVDFLEENSEFVISCSNCNNITFDGSFVGLFNENEIPEITDVNYILRNKWYIPTASIVFRNNKLEIPNWFCKVLNGDYALCLLLTSNGGLVHYENEVRSNYRLHDQGVSNIFINNKNFEIYNYSMLYINRMFNDYSNGNFYATLKINVERYSLEILEFLPIMSKKFWQVSINFFWFNKSISRKYIHFFKNRILINMKALKKVF